MLQLFCYLPTQRERILLFSSLLKDIFKGSFHKVGLKQWLSQCAQFFGNNLKITSGFWKKTLIRYFIRIWIRRKALHSNIPNTRRCLWSTTSSTWESKPLLPSCTYFSTSYFFFLFTSCMAPYFSISYEIFPFWT